MKPGFIIGPMADVDVGTRERWLREFLGEYPELLDDVEYGNVGMDKESTFCFSAIAAKGFLAWCLQKGYGDPESTEDLLSCFGE